MRAPSHAGCGVVITLVGLVAALTPAADSRMYWADGGRHAIESARLDGSNRDVVLLGGDPFGVALDVVAGKVYWTDDAHLGNRICRANLDGSNLEVLVTDVMTPTDIELDVAGGKMYWAETWSGCIRRANLDGSQVEWLYVYAGVLPAGLALDVTGGMLYWTDLMTGKVWRGPIDGGQGGILVTDLYEPMDIELDVARGKMYWTELQASRISRANLDGSGVETLFAAGAIAPLGLALDLHRDVMYWTDARTNRIFRADFRVTWLEVLVDGDLLHPGHIALDLAAGLTIRGDLNCDGTTNFGDINPFVLRLTNPAAYRASYPHCPDTNGDINGDGRIDFADINPFVALLASP